MKVLITSIKRHKLLVIFGFLVIVGTAVVAWVLYGNWADRQNAQRLEERMTSIYHILQEADTKRNWQLTRECQKSSDGFFVSGPSFCAIKVASVSSVDTPEAVKSIIDSNYDALRSHATFLKFNGQTTTIYPDLSDGLKIADEDDYVGRSGGVSIQLTGVGDFYGCDISHTLVSRQDINGTTREKAQDPMSDYFLLSKINCGVRVKKPYYYPKEEWPDALDRQQVDESGY